MPISRVEYNKPIHDYKNTEIVVGSFVAFNYSGSVRLGYVENIGKAHFSYGVIRCTIRIRHQETKETKGLNKITRVTSPDNLVVLDDYVKN